MTWAHMTSSKGRKLILCLYVNNTHLDKASQTSREGEALGKLCEIIYAAE